MDHLVVGVSVFIHLCVHRFFCVGLRCVSGSVRECVGLRACAPGMPAVRRESKRMPSFLSF